MSKFNVMQYAHDLCRQGVARFGGKHNDYLAEAMKIASAKAKSLKEAPIVNEEHRALAFYSVITVLLFVFTLFVAPKAEAAVIEINKHSEIFFKKVVDSIQPKSLQYDYTNTKRVK